MSTHVKKLLASLLAIAMVLSLMPNMVLVSKAADTEGVSAGEFTINGNDISKYTIVWAESILTSIKTHSKYAQFKQYLDSEEYNLQTAKRLQAYIQELCGVELPIKASSAAASEYEILIGDVSRDGLVYTNFGNVDNYEIYVAGNRLVIRGGSFGATWHALDYLEDLGTLAFDANYRYNGNYDIIAIGVVGDSIIHGSTSSTYVKAGADGPLSLPAQLGRLMWKDVATFNYGWAGACLRTDLSSPYMKQGEAKDALNHAPELD